MLAIEARALSKDYRLGSVGSSGRLTELLETALLRPWRLLTPRVAGPTFQALRQLDLDVPVGQRLGLVGRNGAGKSTLLKILSRVVAPSSGRAVVRGRVGALIEVGTGFHPDLTGRENIFLNGAIMGMSRAEIVRHFDAIVAFAEVGAHLDTPVKRYSSGMFMRLGFAVAAHLEAEILIVDEVLSVGDARFRQKCFERIRDVATAGGTVLFVSHNMANLTQICDRAILLDQGKIVLDGSPVDVAHHYLASSLGANAERVFDAQDPRAGNEWVRLQRASLVGGVDTVVSTGRGFDLEVDYAMLREGVTCNVGVVVQNDMGQVVFMGVDNTDAEWHLRARGAGTYRTRVSVPGDLLAEGTVSVSLVLWAGGFATPLRVDDAIRIVVQDDGVLRADYPGALEGVVWPRLRWSTVAR